MYHMLSYYMTRKISNSNIAIGSANIVQLVQLIVQLSSVRELNRAQ